MYEPIITSKMLVVATSYYLELEARRVVFDCLLTRRGRRRLLICWAKENFRILFSIPPLSPPPGETSSFFFSGPKIKLKNKTKHKTKTQREEGKDTKETTTQIDNRYCCQIH